MVLVCQHSFKKNIFLSNSIKNLKIAMHAVCQQ